jgi:predicted Zn-dependent protease
MKATTIKIEEPLLSELEKAKPPSQSITSYVRAILESDIKRHKVAEAAAEYEAFVAAHPEEREWLSDWDRADLSHPPKRSKKA